jgi:hypothetical protein
VDMANSEPWRNTTRMGRYGVGRVRWEGHNALTPGDTDVSAVAALAREEDDEVSSTPRGGFSVPPVLACIGPTSTSTPDSPKSYLGRAGNVILLWA